MVCGEWLKSILDRTQADDTLGLGVPKSHLVVGPICMSYGCSKLQNLGVSRLVVNLTLEDRPVKVETERGWYFPCAG